MDEFITKHLDDMNFRVADIETALRCSLMSDISRVAVEEELLSARRWRDMVAALQARRRGAAADARDGGGPDAAIVCSS
jgi:hypothetical protein